MSYTVVNAKGRRNTSRVPVPVDAAFRQIAKSERRSIAQQAAVVIEKFTKDWQNGSIQRLTAKR